AAVQRRAGASGRQGELESGMTDVVCPMSKVRRPTSAVQKSRVQSPARWTLDETLGTWTLDPRRRTDKHYFTATGAMMCAYGVPFHITYGPPLSGSVGRPSSAFRSGTA